VRGLGDLRLPPDQKKERRKGKEVPEANERNVFSLENTFIPYLRNDGMLE
jgi:hypothetical protein